MKKLMALMMACVLMMACWMPACAAEADGDGALGILINDEPVYSLPAYGDRAVIGEGDMDTLAGTYFRYMSDRPGSLDVGLKNSDGLPRSKLTIGIKNLRAFQGVWRDQRGSTEVTTAPITLKGAKAKATFSGDAQNMVRKAAWLPATAQAFQFLLRSAKAAVTGGEYPAEEVSVTAAVQDWSEFENDLNARQKAAISQYTPLGGVRAKVGLAVGGGSFSYLGNLKTGVVTMETELLPAGQGKSNLVALRVDDDGSTTMVPVIVKGKTVRVVANDLGDYIIIERPVAPVPGTGDTAPLVLWVALALLSGLGMLLIFRKKSFS